MTIKFSLLFSLLLAASTVIANTTIPFQLIGKLIIIELEINGKSGNYILDTGTSDIVLNSQYFSVQGATKMGEAIGISGQPIVVYRHIVNLQIADHHWKKVQAKVLPLAHLSDLKGLPIMGLIGSYIFLDYQLVLDFEQRQLTMIKVAGKEKELPYVDPRPADVLLPFKWKTVMPTIEIFVGGYRLDFGLDTGAEVNILSADHAKTLGDQLVTSHNKNLTGVHHRARLVKSVILKDLVLGQFFCPNLNVVLMPMQKFNFDGNGKPIDGVIGSDFLLHFKAAINFKTRTIALWHRNGQRELIFARDSITDKE